MKVIQCEMCGSRDLLKQDGVFVCQACGTKYSVEEAKKMMVEGTVQVAGTVKVDKSDELKNLYILAERARKSNNSDNAVRYYNQIIEKDPNSWQANFYLIYFKAKNTNVGSIPGVCYDLINCYQSTFELLIEEKGEDITAELNMLIEDIYNFSNIIVNSTWRMQEDGRYQGHALEILSKFGDKLIEVYRENYEDIAVTSWRKTMQVYQNILNNCENNEIANTHAQMISFFYDINDVLSKLKSHSKAKRSNNMNIKKICSKDIEVFPGFTLAMKYNIKMQNDNPGILVCTDINDPSEKVNLQICNILTGYTKPQIGDVQLTIYLRMEQEEYEQFIKLSISSLFNCSWNDDIDMWECCIDFGEDYDTAAFMITYICYEVYNINEFSKFKMPTWKDDDSRDKGKNKSGCMSSILLLFSPIIAGLCYMVHSLLA